MKSAACAGVRENLSPYLEGELPAGPAGEIRAHLEGCPGCRAELEFLRLTIGGLRSLPELPPPAGILAGVRARLRPEPWYRRFLDRRQWLLGVPVGAVATLLVIVGISLFQMRIPVSEKMSPPAVREAREALPAPPLAPPAAPPAAEGAPAETAASRAPAAPAAPSAPRPLPQPQAADETRRTTPEAPAPPALTPTRVLEDAAIEKELPGPGVEPRTAVRWREPEIPIAAQGRDADEAEWPQVRTEETAPLSRFVLPEPQPVPERTTAIEDATAERAVKTRSAFPGRSAAVGALEADPKQVSSLRTPGSGAPARSARTVQKSAAPRAVSPAPGRPAEVRRAGGEFRMAGAPPPADRESQPGMVSLGTSAPAPPAGTAPASPEAETVLEARRQARPEVSRRILLLVADGVGINDLKRLLRREGAGEVESRVLEPRAVQEAFAPHRGRIALPAPPSRGWSLRAEIPPRALPRLLDALADTPGLLLLEHPDPQMGAARAAAPVQLRITVLR